MEAMADEAYRKFSSSLLPGVGNILGVRLPRLRAIAKRAAKGQWRKFLDAAPREYFEDDMLCAMIIGAAEMDFKERLSRAEAFLPRISNWSVCDSFCASLKIGEGDKAAFFEFLESALARPGEYEKRFALVCLLDFYVSRKWLGRALGLIASFKSEDYYARMAAAWAVCEFYTKFPEETLELLKGGALDDFTHAAAIRKISESRAVGGEVKAAARALARGRKKSAPGAMPERT